MFWSSDFHSLIGQEIGVSSWKTIAQDRIDRFAEATEDFQFVHTDPDRARKETPFGGTIAHGFLTLSMVSALAAEALPASPELKGVILAGVDKVKFISAVKSGSRIRGVFTLARASKLAPGKIVFRLHCAVEIEGEPKSALSCEVCWVVLLEEPAPARELLSA